MKILSVALFFLLTGFGNAIEKPNIILIYTDDHGWPDIGAAGIYDDLKTPNIDALAASGVRATNGYSTAPQCVPSRAGLLAGRSQNRFGVESNGGTLEGFDAQTTLAERLKEAGYATGQIGKWHLGPTNKITDHGFDDVYSKNANRPCHANYTLAGETIPMQVVNDQLYHLDACSEAALAFIKRHADDPFFLYLAYRAPHVPLDAPPSYLDRFPGKMPERRRQALAMISAMDDGVGKIVADLKARGLEEKTVIFYIGDNGAPLKIHKLDAPGGGPGWDGSLNEPMNGEKGMLAEGGIRVPFLVAWPGKIPGGQVYEQPITTLDVAATAVELAGLPTDDKLDGVNLVPFLRGKKAGAPHEFLMWRWVAQAAIRADQWKLLVGGTREYLFDLSVDPGEKKNLLTENPEVADRLRKRLNRWADELDPPGLTTGKMSATWEDYFDFYLDGKPPKPKGEAAQTEEGNAFQGWNSRNSELKNHQGSLRMTPNAAAKAQKAFLVRSGLNLDGTFKAGIKFRSTNAGNVSVAWRTKQENDFMEENFVSKAVPGSPDFQEVELEIPATGTTIHARVLLPDGVVDIKEIVLESQDKTNAWNFSNP